MQTIKKNTRSPYRIAVAFCCLLILSNSCKKENVFAENEQLQALSEDQSTKLLSLLNDTHFLVYALQQDAKTGFNDISYSNAVKSERDKLVNVLKSKYKLKENGDLLISEAINKYRALLHSAGEKDLWRWELVPKPGNIIRMKKNTSGAKGKVSYNDLDDVTIEGFNWFMFRQQVNGIITQNNACAAAIMKIDSDYDNLKTTYYMLYEGTPGGFSQCIQDFLESIPHIVEISCPNGSGDPGGSGGGGGDGGGGGSGGGSGSYGPEQIVTYPLEDKYPCAARLVVKKLMAIEEYKDLVQPFIQDFVKPQLVFSSTVQDWGPTKFSMGETTTQGSKTGASSIIFLNSKMIENASELMVAATTIHETYHAYLNYTFAFGENPGFVKPLDNSYIVGYYVWQLYQDQSVDNNYSHHYALMRTKFDELTNILHTFGAGRFTLTECRMAMLYGLNNPGPGATLEQYNFIGASYNNMLSDFGFTPAALNAFHQSQLNAAPEKKVPTDCP